MKTKEEIARSAFLEYPRLINDPYNPMEDDNTYERQIWINGYTQCQENVSNSWTKGCECKDSIGQTWCCNQCGLPYDTRKEQDWIDFAGHLMDWAHELGKEQKYIPFPAQILEWLKNNYKTPQKK